MKKRLLFSLMAMCVAVSGFALTANEYVYTPQGRFLITGENINANNAFSDLSGWTVVAEGKELADKFNIVANGYSEGFNSVQSLENTVDEGMYFRFEPTDANLSYVVSFKMKGAVLDDVRIRVPGDGNKTRSAYNIVKVAGNSGGTFGADSLDYLCVNTAEELNENWQTFNYAIQGDGTARIWFISFMSMATTIEIADLQIAPAIQYADLRQRDAMVEKLEAYKNCYAWPEEALADLGYEENLAALKAIGDESGQAELDELLEVADEILNEFQNTYMDDFLAANPDNYLGIKTTSGNTQKVSNLGDWTATTTGRAFWSNGDYPDLGHYAGNTAWNFGNTGDPMGVYMEQTLDQGTYVFTIESKAALREDPTSSSWTLNEGWNPAYGVAYIVKKVDGVATDTIASIVKDVDSRLYVPFMITAKIDETGTYEIGFKAYCKDDYKSLACGSVTYVRNASLWAKTNNKYTKREYAYEEYVRTQITTGRDNLTTAAGYLADDSYYWGKDELKGVMDEIEPKIAAYEALDQDAIIATFDRDLFANTTADSTGIMVYEVYQEAVKYIIAANKQFLAVNDTLASIQPIIDEAETTLQMRLYDAATGKNDLMSAISEAKTVKTTMMAVQYSEANAAYIVEANAKLKEAIEVFKTTVPASAITTIVDIDFENDAVQNAETQRYSVPGAAGSMEFDVWSTDGTGTQPFEKGYWSNGEQLWKGYIRVGGGTGTVVFDPTENGSMGSNILKVACDMYVQGLSGRSVGFFLKNVVAGETGDEDAEIFGLFHNFYNGTNSNNTCNVDVSKIWAKSGGSYNNASPADADEETLTANPLQKSHIEVIMDYGRKSMYCTINSVNGSTTSQEVALDAVPTKFILQSNYNNNDRRIWFDNLKIERIAAGETEPFVDGIKELNSADIKAVVPTKVFINGRVVINGKIGLNGIVIK